MAKFSKNVRSFCSILFMIALPCFCYGDEYDEEAKDPLFANVQKFKKIVDSSLPVIEGRIRQMNPTLVESAKNDTNEQKIVKYNNYLAQTTFDDYLDYFFWKLRRQKEKTNREIKRVGSNDFEEYWLDRGIMESKQCKGSYKHKNNSKKEIEKELRDEREHTCLYPNGFEEFWIHINKNSLSASIDDKLNNVRNMYSISLSLDSNADNPDNVNSRVTLIVSKVVYDYTDWYKYRNQEKQDIKNGMYQYIPKERQNCNEMFCPVIEAKDIASWKSSKMIPNAKIRMTITERNLSDSTEHGAYGPTRSTYGFARNTYETGCAAGGVAFERYCKNHKNDAVCIDAGCN